MLNGRVSPGKDAGRRGGSKDEEMAELLKGGKHRDTNSHWERKP